MNDNDNAWIPGEAVPAAAESVALPAPEAEPAAPQAAAQPPAQPAVLPPAQPMIPPPNIPPPPMAAAPKPVPLSLPHKTADVLLAVLSLVTAFLFFRWGAWGGAAGMAATYVLFFGCITAFAGRRSVRALRWDLLLSGISALAVTLSCLLFDDPFFRPIKVCAVIFLTAWYLCGLYQHTRYSEGSLLALLDIAALLIVSPFRYISLSLRTLFKGREGKRSKLKMVLIGLAAAVPVLLVAGVLLSNADAAFEAALKRFLETLGQSALQLLLAVILFFPLFSLLFALTRGEELPKQSPAQQKEGRVDPVITTTFLAAVSLLYVAYLCTQLAYFFSGFAGLLPEEYSAAEYARRGFFELCAVAGINLIMLLLAAGLSRRRENRKLPLPVQILSAFICLFTLILIAVAESKMALYVQHFGMTRMRLMVSLFMLLLAFAFVLLMIQIFVERFAYMKVLLAAGCLLLLAMSFAGVDRTVLRYNKWAYEKGHLETIDTTAYWELGDDKISYLIELSYSRDETMREPAKEQLKAWLAENENLPATLASYNYTKQKAQEYMTIYLDRDDCPLWEVWQSFEIPMG